MFGKSVPDDDGTIVQAGGAVIQTDGRVSPSHIAGAESVGAHKTSMLQDVEVGRSLEVEALIGAVLEIAQLTNTPAPATQAVYACVKLLNKTMVLQGAGVRLAAE